MTQQYNRVVDIQVDTIKLGDLDASFRVVKTLKKEPNTCELTIYNLNPEHRAQLAETKSPQVRVSAGYKGNGTAASSALQAVDSIIGTGGDPSSAGVGLIFEGNLRDVGSDYEPPDWITSLESGDGEKAAQFSRTNRSFPPGTLLAKVLQTIAGDMEVGAGNVDLMALRATLLEGGKSFLTGVTASGPAHKEFDRLIRSSGLEWSVQDEVLQLLGVGEPLFDSAVILTAETGLIGSPTIGNDGVVRGTALMNSNIVPGRLLTITSKSVNGGFRAERCEYIGSKSDVPFYVDFEASELAA